MAATSDTLALAAAERAKQGIHELEFSFGGELDLHKHLNACEKKPGHREFIPIRKLMLYHIPEHNSRNRIFEWVRHMSRYTVKLSVRYVSPNRPPGYPLSDRAGQRVLTVGSGYVADIPSRGNYKIPCPLTNCGELPGDHEVCGYFTVVTAAHVVHDDQEAKNTTVEFFDDDPDDRRGVVTARGVKVAAFSEGGDFCELLCVAHDASLVQRLNEPRICMPYFTFKFNVCFSCNHGRAPEAGHGCNQPTRTRRGYHLGGEYVYPFGNYYELQEDYDVHGKITVTTANHFVDEATNAAVEFLYDNPDGKMSDMTDSRDGGNVCMQLCVTHDACKFEWVYCLREIGELSGRRICDLFQALLPGIKNIKCTSGICFTFLVEIRLRNLSEALQSLALLQLYTVEDVNYLLKMSKCGYNSHDLLTSTSFKIADILHLIKYELRLAEFIEEYRPSTSFLSLRKKLTDLGEALRKPDAENPKNHWHNFLSIISELVQFYCTVEKLGKRLSLKSEYPEFFILNSQEVVSIKNDTATVEVTILRRNKRDNIRGYNSTSLDHWSHCEESDSKNTKYLNELKPTAKELKPNDMLVHIAHPHGQSKQVTIGRLTDCFTGNGFYRQMYTAPTCPGCSGGPVWMIPASGDLSQVYGVPHSGHIGNELNKGCSWTVYPHQFKL